MRGSRLVSASINASPSDQRSGFEFPSSFCRASSNHKNFYRAGFCALSQNLPLFSHPPSGMRNPPAGVKDSRSTPQKGLGEVSRKSKGRIFREVKSHTGRNLPSVKMAKHGIPDHCLQMGQVIALRGNPAAARIIPRCGKAAGLFRRHSEKDFLHVRECRRDCPVSQAERESGRNPRKSEKGNFTAVEIFSPASLSRPAKCCSEREGLTPSAAKLPDNRAGSALHAPTPRPIKAPPAGRQAHNEGNATRDAQQQGNSVTKKFPSRNR